MLMVGFDLGKRKSWVVIEAENGEIILDAKVATTVAALSAVFADLKRCTILLEASTSSEWVSRCLERMGHIVIVADPNFGPMYASADKRLKTDRRDAHALLCALRVGAFRVAVRRTDDEMLLKALLSSRDALVRNRAKLINRTRATLQRFGIVEGENPEPRGYADAVRRNCTVDRLATILEPSLRALDALSKEVAALDDALETAAAANPVVVKLDQIPGVGRITALAFVYALSDVKRFRNADAVAAYLGLVPSINASGDREHRGGITKRGDRVARSLLHTAALTIMRSRNPAVRELRQWALDLSRRRGGKKRGGNAIARSALARRLARILFAMWRDDTHFKVELTAGALTKEESAAA